MSYGRHWLTDAIGTAVDIAAQLSNVVPELLLVLATWRHAYSTSRLANEVGAKTPITTTLIRDGQSEVTHPMPIDSATDSFFGTVGTIYFL